MTTGEALDAAEELIETALQSLRAGHPLGAVLEHLAAAERHIRTARGERSGS